MNNKKYMGLVVVGVLLLLGVLFVPIEAQGPFTEFRNLRVLVQQIIDDSLLVKGEVQIAVPTAQGTATPGFLINNAGVSNAFEIQDASTPAFYVDASGNTNVEGQLNIDEMDIDSWINIAVPTAQATATPGLYMSNSSIADSVYIASGDVNFHGQTIINPFPAVAVGAASGNVVEILGTTGVFTTGTNTENFLNIDIAVGNATAGTNVVNAIKIDDITGDAEVTEVGLDIGSGFDTAIVLQNGESIDNSTDAQIKFTDGTNTLATIVDAGTTGNLNLTGALDVQGGVVTLQNDEAISNATNGRVKITDGTNTLIEVIDQGTTGDLNVTAALTVTGLADLNGGIAVDTSNFTVSGTNGNVVTAGSLDVAGGNITLQNDETIDNSADGVITMTVSAGGSVTVKTGNLRVGDGAEGQTINGEDAYIEGLVEVDGILYADGGITSGGAAALDGGITVDTTNFTVDGTTGAVSTASTLGVTGLSTLSGGESIPLNIENMRQPSILTVAITYTAAAGGTGVVATIGAGEIWLVHDVLVQVTESFVADTGNDATLTIGDGNVADGLFTATNDANLAADYSEGTGYPAGWVGMGPDEKGAYLDVNGHGFIYDPAAEETIDWAVDETSGETLSAGAATIYVFYTRIE